ncbi:YdcF family protein [Marinilabilia salmonicolor]|uniref:YdcF family protein n=1 Tax=Marinilabilia salmonicolor TaxID=989 RepID=UPI001F404EFF|nr:YdcF family protein [Marinilabilia salmonicolor]
MFFILSKILNVLFSPFVWVLLLLLAGLFFKKENRRVIHIMAFGILLLFSNGAVFQGVVRLWESEPVALSHLSGNNRNVVVLGGMLSENQYNGLPRFNQSSDRFWQAFYLLKTGIADTLLISGGLGTLFDEQTPEADMWKAYLKKTGMLSGNILTESQSRNTYENALNSAKLFEEKQLSKRIILVTSSFHMPRAGLVLRSRGFR